MIPLAELEPSWVPVPEPLKNPKAPCWLYCRETCTAPLPVESYHSYNTNQPLDGSAAVMKAIPSYFVASWVRRFLPALLLEVSCSDWPLPKRVVPLLRLAPEPETKSKNPLRGFA